MASFLASLAVQAASLTYVEPIPVEWGLVTFQDNGNEVQEVGWFARRSPTFAIGDSFTASQRLCLSNALLVCTGRVGGEIVWRMDASLNSDPGFVTRAREDQCVGSENLRVTKGGPDAWEEGQPKNLVWPLTIKYEPPPVEMPPTLELALVANEVPSGSAWEVPVALAITQPDLLSDGALSDATKAAVVASTNWARLFLVAESSLGANPAVEPLSAEHLARLRIPISFGMGALAAIAPRFSTNRTFVEANLVFLESRLNPSASNSFPGADLYFPETRASRAALDLDSIATETQFQTLFQASRPPISGPFATRRVLTNRQEWAVKVGPFRLLEAPVARVGQLRGRTQLHPRESLPVLFTNNPAELASREAALVELDASLMANLPAASPLGGSYFWLPDLTNAHQRVMRTLEGVRYTEPASLKARFQTNRFVYLATYAPVPIVGKVGATYAPEHGFGGQVEGGFTGLPRPTDSLHLKASVAQRAIDGELSYKSGYRRSLDRRNTYHLEAFGAAGRDEQFRLGSLSPAPFRHDLIEGGFAHEIRHRGDRFGLTVRDEASWQAHDLLASGTRGATSDGGLILHHRQVWSLDRDTGSGPIREYSIAPGLSYGPKVGWDGSFWHGELAAGARFRFHGEDRRGMYVSIRGTLGVASGEVPQPLLYRLGDANRLFGLQPGEYSGRSFTHGEFSYGLGLRDLMNNLFAPGQSPPSFDGLFLRAIAEIGSVSTGSGIRAVSDPDQVLSSFGAAFEKSLPELGGGVGFQLGYAWSPDGKRSGGRLFTALSWSF